MQVIKTLLEHGSDPLQANEKGLTPADICKDPKIIKMLRGSSSVEGEQGNEGQVKAGGNETIKGDDREEEEDEDVFEAKVETSETSQDTLCTSTAPKRLRGKPEQCERDRGSQSSEGGIIASKMASVRKQLKDDFSSEVATCLSDEAQSSSTVAEGGRNSTSGGGDGSLTKLVGKAVPFFSDISSSESESELPEVKLINLKNKEDSPPPSAEESVGEVGEQEREKELEKEEKRQASPVEVREEREEEKSPSMKEEAKVKMLEDQGMAAFGEYTV